MMKELDQKKFKRICIALRIVLYVVMACMAYFVIFTAVVYIPAFASDGKLIYPLMTAERVLEFLPMVIAANFGALAFRSMSRSETPFMYDVSDKIKAASMWLIIGSAVHTVFTFILQLTGFMDEMRVDFLQIIMGVMLFALVYVIEQGCRLQKESDETL